LKRLKESGYQKERKKKPIHRGATSASTHPTQIPVPLFAKKCLAMLLPSFCSSSSGGAEERGRKRKRGH